MLDRYDDVSAKDHGGMRRTGSVSMEYSLTPIRHLPSRYAFLNNTVNKRRLSSVLGTFYLGVDTMMDIRDIVVFHHEGSHVNPISYMIQATEAEKNAIRSLSYDTDVFVDPSSILKSCVGVCWHCAIH